MTLILDCVGFEQRTAATYGNTARPICWVIPTYYILYRDVENKVECNIRETFLKYFLLY